MYRIRNDKGLTLIEVLAAVVILSFIVLTFSYLFTQGTKNSKTEENRDQSVAIARSLMEEIKMNLTKGGTIQFHSNPINLDMIRNASTVPVPLPALTLAYPQATDGSYKVEITADPVLGQKITVASNDFPLTNYFRLVKIKVTEQQFQSVYVLESYLEYNNPSKGS